ncbi:ABC-type antimicrobial peptide transport system permease component [Ignavibacterium album JCM 16511]|uniref:ABC-type antimicrobial peptide transport system permease component n=1 Tax=Ignavibacterium album (strain DSM 19864 / JCM 16511 / NBRC 101810 / Mat9-16) TaxID=945713 RepID=I0AK98_IGNAJ|nr:ABC transporter permease [Ignavibacterium album]AFH49405.1 ABC-type antimicrobial peptide transport system permease component [Ignavibacterium album JCM 16511]
MRVILFEFKEGMMIALRAIASNKIRAMLTMLGIFIGVTVVVTMSTAIKGIDNSFQQGISSLGSDVLYIDKWAWFSNVEWWKMRNRRNITMEEFEKFKNLAKHPVAVAPVINTVQTVKYQERRVENVFINGSNADYVKTTNFTFSEGRFYSEIESNGSRQVAVIGSEVAKKLFPNLSPLDKTIKIGGENFRVVGVLAEQGSFILGPWNPDNQIYVPIGTIFKNFASNRWRSITINVRAASPAMVEETKAEAEGIMRKVRGLSYDQENDFSINQQEGLQENYNSVVGVIQIAGLFITGLSLFVGAIGIMNIMFVSVKERTKEIGLRKAIGAKRRTILAQFLLESSVICLVGGLAGLIAAIILSMIINQFIPTSIQIGSVILGIGISLLTGIVSGIAPAYTAAKMDPVEALRYE